MIDDMDKFHSVVGSMSDSTKVAPLEHAFWTSTYMFSDAKLKSEDLQRVFVFSNDDNPIGAHGNNAKQALITRAQVCKSSQPYMCLY
jgi:hypothetical protein